MKISKLPKRYGADCCSEMPACSLQAQKQTPAAFSLMNKTAQFPCKNQINKFHFIKWGIQSLNRDNMKMHS
jgi:hypothetical protein